MSNLQKTVYLVRHGETEYNAALRHQDNSVVLSKQGVKQADALVTYFASLPVEVCIASAATRTQATLQPLALALGHELIIEPLFNERKDPAEIEHQYKSDPAVKKIEAEILARSEDADWHYADEENYHDMIARARTALQYLTNRPESSLVVATHHKMIKYLFGALADPTLPAPLWRSLIYEGMNLNNGSVTVLTKNPADSVTDNWRVVTWGDVSHLRGL